MKINNTKYALLSASQDFMVTVLMLASGIVTDRMVGESEKTHEKRRTNILLGRRKGYRVWKLDIYCWLYFHRSCYDDSQLRVHGVRNRCVCAGRYRHASCAVQNLFILVSAK